MRSLFINAPFLKIEPRRPVPPSGWRGLFFPVKRRSCGFAFEKKYMPFAPDCQAVFNHKKL
jgi:hypothetical protein